MSNRRRRLEYPKRIAMPIFLTIVAVFLFAAWVTHAYPAPSFLGSLRRAVQAFIDWLLGAITRR